MAHKCTIRQAGQYGYPSADADLEFSRSCYQTVYSQTNSVIKTQPTISTLRLANKSGLGSIIFLGKIQVASRAFPYHCTTRKTGGTIDTKEN